MHDIIANFKAIFSHANRLLLWLVILPLLMLVFPFIVLPLCVTLAVEADHWTYKVTGTKNGFFIDVVNSLIFLSVILFQCYLLYLLIISIYRIWS